MIKMKKKSKYFYVQKKKEGRTYIYRFDAVNVHPTTQATERKPTTAEQCSSTGLE